MGILNPARRRVLAGCAVCTGLAMLSACTSVGLYTGAAGTQEDAREVVRLVYGQGSPAEIQVLPYEGGDLSKAVQRLRDRYPRLQPWYAQGVIGNTSGGFVAVRDVRRRSEVSELVRAENRDRALLYVRGSVEVGHGTDDLESWLPYERESFGTEWIEQSPAGWWFLGKDRQWHEKTTSARVPPAREPGRSDSRFIW
ncbi:DUF1318 domain-containing protein [Oryzomicrobium sp.]|uniref:DUF1318 domain-containing protein n=1 Tax=Oryzomicrobium sp. TaxID=1911578 RepID=UPI0025F97177|nr:DUF1318 domain-containing protein [Oryzomicrobium sp.]MCE1242763.1 YdbL family protein [Oryzomicrobium sp.]